MKTLVYFARATQKHLAGEVEDKNLSFGGILRVIYYKPDIRSFAFWLSKARIAKHIKNCAMFSCPVSKRLRGEKIYRDGSHLAYRHIKSIVFSSINKSEKDNITVFTTKPDHLKLLSDIVTSVKDISILTTPDMTEIFDAIMLEEYGIAGAVHSCVPVCGRTVLIMPGGEIFSARGAENIINLSGADIGLRCLTPLSVNYKAPKGFGGTPAVLTNADALETAMDFFNIDYSLARVSSVKFYK